MMASCGWLSCSASANIRLTSVCTQVIALMVPAIGIANGVGCEDAKLHKKIVKKNLRDTAGIQCLAEMGILREDYTKKLSGI